MEPLKVVIDTNVVYSAFRSGGVPANIVDWALQCDGLVPCVSNSLILEYENVLKRGLRDINGARAAKDLSRLTPSMVDGLLDLFIERSYLYAIRLSARPALTDDGDEKVLDLVLVSGGTLVTGNIKDFSAAIGPYGISVLSCSELVRRVTGQKT